MMGNSHNFEDVDDRDDPRAEEAQARDYADFLRLRDSSNLESWIWLCQGPPAWDSLRETPAQPRDSKVPQDPPVLHLDSL